MSEPLLSVVLPTYNEAANIAPLLQALQDELASHDVEFVVVDDDSPDGTADAARGAGVGARVLVRTDEKGLGTAVVHGIREARGRYVLVMDTDFQHPPSVAPRMLDAARSEGADLVIGSRYVAGGTEGDFAFYRRVISRGAANLSRLFLPPVRRHGLTDPMSGLFLVRREAVDCDGLDPKGYKILLEILAKTPLERVAEVGYRFDTRRDGESKLGALVILQYLWHLTLLGWAHPENQRIFRFGMVGGTGVVVNLSLLWFLTERVGLHYLASAAISVEASIINNFLLNDRFTFHDKRAGHFFGRLARFNAVSLGALTINLSTLFVLTEVFHIYYLVSEGFAILVSFGANYLGNMHWTYGGGNRFRLRRFAKSLTPWIPLAAVVLGAGWLFADDLDRADEVYFDEHYYISVAYQINAGTWEDPCWVNDELDHRPLNFEHPPLAKLIIAWSVSTFDGDHDVFEGCREPDSPAYNAFLRDLRDTGNPYAWRGPSVVFGMMTVAFAGLAAGRIFRNPQVGALAGAFVALDGVVFTSARLAILDIYAAGFAMMAVYFATFPGRRGILLSALALGLGFASKYTVVFAGIPVLILLLWTNWRHGRLSRRVFDASVAAFVLIPNWVLISTYLPWWRIWVPELGLWGAVKHWATILWEGITYGASLQSDHKYGLPSTQWFADAKPTFYYQMSNVAGIPDLNRYIYAVGNPALWWAAAAAVLVIAARYIAGVIATMRTRGAGLVAAIRLQPEWLQALWYAALLPGLTYLAFVVLPRETFLFYMTILVPLLAIPLAGLLVMAWDRGTMAGRIGVPVVLLVIVAAFLHYYPITSGANVTAERFAGIMDAVPWMRP